MGKLRTRMEQDLVVRGLSVHTQRAYVHHVKELAQYYGRSGLPGVPQIRARAIDPNTPSTVYAGTGPWGVRRMGKSPMCAHGGPVGCVMVTLRANLAARSG